MSAEDRVCVDPQKMRESWEEFLRGDRRLEDIEVRSMLEDVRMALPYLRARGDRLTLAYVDAMQTEARLSQMMEARKRK